MKALRPLLLTVAFLALFSSRPGWADLRTLSLTPDQTEITFDLDATGHDVHGTLSLAEAEVLFDSETGTASGTITIDASGADTGNPKRDKKMHNSVLLSVKFPQIEFTPTALVGELADAGTSEVTLKGTVNIVGGEHPLEMTAQVEIDGDTVHFETTFEVPYVDWGLKNPSLFVLRVAKSVTVTIVGDGTLTTEVADDGTSD